MKKGQLILLNVLPNLLYGMCFYLLWPQIATTERYTVREINTIFYWFCAVLIVASFAIIIINFKFLKKNERLFLFSYIIIMTNLIFQISWFYIEWQNRFSSFSEQDPVLMLLLILLHTFFLVVVIIIYYNKMPQDKKVKKFFMMWSIIFVLFDHVIMRYLGGASIFTVLMGIFYLMLWDLGLIR